KFMQSIKNGFGKHCFGIAEDHPKVGQQTNAQTWLALLGFRHKRNSRIAGKLWPLAADSVGNGDQGFPDISITILYLVRKAIGPFDFRAGCPLFDQITNSVTLALMQPKPEGLDLLAGVTAAHPDDYRAR